MIATGAFSLIGVQDAVINESIYKRTAQNVKPETPVSDSGKIPEGWSATMLDVSASFPYLWESQRARTEMYSSNDISNAVLVYAGYRISNTGNKVSDANYKYSDDIKLSKGQVIEVNTAGSSVSVISLSNGSATFTPIKTLNNTVPQVCTYLADEDCNVVVCVKTTSAYSVKIYTASYGAWSTPTLKNSWGKQGAKLRMRTWAEGVEYLQGADGEEFYDVVVYNNKLYLCTKTHTSDSNNNPSSSISGYLGFWESAQEWTFIATKLLLAEKINAEQINADGIKAKNVDIEGIVNATSGTFKGEINVGNGTNVILSDGSSSLARGNISWNAQGEATFGKSVRFEGFIKHAYIPPVIVELNGLYKFYLKLSDIGNLVTIPTAHEGDSFILPRGEQWNGTLLYVWNFSNKYRLIVSDSYIPANGVGVFFGAALAQSNPQTTIWSKVTIADAPSMLGVAYEDLG